jgi:hypothetical protein
MFSTAFQCRGRRRRKFLCAHRVDRYRDFAGERVEDRLRFANKIGLGQRLADRAARGEDERIGDAAANDQHVDLGGERA